MAAARAHPNITFFEHHLATDLVWDEVGGVQHCLGADVLDQRGHSMSRFVAPATLLATGGAGQVSAFRSSSCTQPTYNHAALTAQILCFHKDVGMPLNPILHLDASVSSAHVIEGFQVA